MLALLRQRRRLLPYSGSYSIRDPKEECGWRDLNPHGCPPAPKAGASASSATSAWSPIESHYSVFEKNCQLRFCLIFRASFPQLQYTGIPCPRTVTGFCRCFAFQVGKIRGHNGIIRNFQFRKFLPMKSNFPPTDALKYPYLPRHFLLFLIVVIKEIIRPVSLVIADDRF